MPAESKEGAVYSNREMPIFLKEITSVDSGKCYSGILMHVSRYDVYRDATDVLAYVEMIYGCRNNL